MVIFHKLFKLSGAYLHCKKGVFFLAVKKWRDRAAKEPLRTEETVKASSLEEIRGFIRKAAEIKDPREMWFFLRDIMNLLTLLVVSEPDVILPGDV